MQKQASVLLLSSVLVLGACGGAQEEAKHPSGDNSSESSEESGGGASKDKAKDSADKDMAGPDTSEEKTADKAATDKAADKGADKDKGGGGDQGSAGGAGDTASAGGGSASASGGHPAPSVTGSIDGKPFSPTVAHVNGKVGKDGRILLVLDEGTDCSGSSGKSGAGVLTVMVSWKKGDKTDLSSLKRASKKGTGEIAFNRLGAGGKKQLAATFKPSGTVTVISAPTTAKSTGKVNIDLQSGDYMLAGDLDVLVCK